MKPTTSGKPLTEREVEVVQNLSQGKTNKEIGEILGISIHTVKFHLENINKKMGTSTRTGAAVKWCTELCVSQSI
jgi:DNA-binding CsgD family transcriptional regulator